MKGIVFREFMDMIEEKFGLTTIDKLLGACPLHSGGVYTNVGTYDHQEIITMVTKLHEYTGVPVDDLIVTFAEYLFQAFTKKYPVFFEGKDCFSFIKSVEDYIHVEVKKLYPKAELPTFKYDEPSKDQLYVEYSSARPFSVLAKGLLQASVLHFKEDIDIEVEYPDETKKDYFCNFKLRRAAA